MPGAIMKSPFEFKQDGQSGRWVSSVFPQQAKLVDEMAFLMAMTTKTNVHGPATYMMNNGFLCESANIQEIDPAFADMPILRARRDNVNLRAVLSNSFGFGGTNATLVFKHIDA